MPPSRFGASKWRNATVQIPQRTGWSRQPNSSLNTSASSTSTFSSEIKVNREYIVTLTSSGDLTWRHQDGSAETGVAKVGSGGGVGDWDLGGLEGGQSIVGGLDGVITIYSLPVPGPDVSLRTTNTIKTPGSIRNISVHPTTPGIFAASSLGHLSIYDTTSASPVITLELPESKGTWSISWSPNGTHLAAIGQSGTLYIFSPRTSTQHTTEKQLNIQAIKPSRIVWLNETSLFITSFSKTRNRQYSLYTLPNLTEVFTNPLDTSTSPHIPIVDPSRELVYLSARGDMSIRQVECTGPMGFQETSHPLPHALSYTGLALGHGTRLDVMVAEIGKVWVAWGDAKDGGDALVGISVRVPRRQLIDYHADLFPDIRGTVPKQSAEQWFGGADSPPELISLDPTQRGVFQAALAEWRSKQIVDDSLPASSSAATAQAPKRSTEIAEDAETGPSPHSTPSTQLQQFSTTDTPSAIGQASEPSPSKATSSGASADSLLPALSEGETHSSSSYKARIMGDHIVHQLQAHRAAGKKEPFFVGLQGPQGCGKTTLCNSLVQYLADSPRSLKTAVLSLDDLYKTNKGLKDLSLQYPDNKLLAGRGPPGTHDIDLAQVVLREVSVINTGEGKTAQLPIFDKSLCGGEGDRSTETITISGPLDVFILEGWSMGFTPLSDSDLPHTYESKTSLTDTTYFLSQPLKSLKQLNTNLSSFASVVYPYFATTISVVPESYQYVFEWRLQQERMMKAGNGGKGMTDDEVKVFVERYMPGYELWSVGSESEGLRLRYGSGREVVGVEKVAGRPDPEFDVNKGSSFTPSSQVESTQAGSVAKAKTSLPLAIETTATSGTVAEVSHSVQPVSSKAHTTSTSNPVPAKTSISPPFNPNYSRKFLTSKSPLIPSYDQVPSIAALHPDSIILKTTKHLAFFPILGPGGRLVVHPLRNKGRMDKGDGAVFVSAGVEIGDFDVESFEDDSGVAVAIAGEDGGIRVWRVGVEGPGNDSPAASAILKGKGVDKIAQIAFHPTAKDLLTAVANDSGSSSLRLFDLSSSEEVLVLSLDAAGVFNMSWSPLGDRVAISTKDGNIIVVDPRNPSSSVTGKAHDSPRSFQLAWISSTHLLSVGFSKGSQRKINLYTITSTSISTQHSYLIDTSPSVLFPVYDPDTSILYIWGKGERQIQAFEIHPENTLEPIQKLPGYTAGNPQLGVAFGRKVDVDVKKVQVGRCLRLTGKTLEEVEWSIPRNKPDFFQDDIFVDTKDTSRPSTTAKAWLDGDNTPPKTMSLQPPGMTPLSQAPKTNTAAKAKFVPARDVMTEAEKKKREMDKLFEKAKMDESSDEEGDKWGPSKGGLKPPDDDW